MNPGKRFLRSWRKLAAGKSGTATKLSKERPAGPGPSETDASGHCEPTPCAREVLLQRDGEVRLPQDPIARPWTFVKSRVSVFRALRSVTAKAATGMDLPLRPLRSGKGAMIGPRDDNAEVNAGRRRSSGDQLACCPSVRWSGRWSFSRAGIGSTGSRGIPGGRCAGPVHRA